MRSLPHQILLQRHDLIRLAFLQHFEAFCFGRNGEETFEPTYWELKRALEALIKSCPHERFFFSVDGIDEYDADNHKMGAFKTLSKLPNAKLLLTSRQWVGL